MLTANGQEALEVPRQSSEHRACSSRTITCGTDETGVQVIAAVRQKLGKQVPAVLMTGDTSTAVQELTCDPRLRTASKPHQSR